MAATETPPSEARVLVVDDEYGVREGSRRALVSEGFETDTADSGEHGLELLQRNPYDLVFVDLRMPGMDGLEFLAQTGEYRDETVFVVITGYATLETAVDATKRGAWYFIAKPFTPDELIGAAHTALRHGRLVRESNRLQAEREVRLLELATEKGRLHSIVESMGDGVIVTNRDGQMVLHNAAALWAVRCPVGEGEPLPLRDCIHPPELVDLIEEAQVGTEVRRISREIILDVAQARVMRASVSPVHDAAGQCLGAVTVLNDVSELKQVEQVKAQFVNMVAHELRAPLAAIASHVSLLRLGMANDPEHQQHILDRAHLRLQGLLDMVGDLLTVSRIEAGTLRREIRPMDLSEIVHEVCDLTRPQAQQQRITVAAGAPTDLPPLEGDRQEITALLSNLVSNAVKYNRPGGSVTVAVRNTPPYIEIQVTDSGVGISPEGLSRVFDEFYRERTDDTREVSGTGLGLAIVKRIVDLHHGTVSAQSEVGKGSTFTVRLPRSQS